MASRREWHGSGLTAGAFASRHLITQEEFPAAHAPSTEAHSNLRSFTTPGSFIHSLTFISLFIVAASGLFVLGQCWRRMLLVEFVAVAMSVAAAAYWIAVSYMLSNIAVCRADSTLCLYGTAYQLIRNVAFALFHLPCADEPLGAFN